MGNDEEDWHFALVMIDRKMFNLEFGLSIYISYNPGWLNQVSRYNIYNAFCSLFHKEENLLSKEDIIHLSFRI